MRKELWLLLSEPKFVRDHYLKGAGHEGVVHAGLAENTEVDVEGTDVNGSGDSCDQSGLGDELQAQLEVSEPAIGEASPEVTEEDEAA